MWPAIVAALLLTGCAALPWGERTIRLSPGECAAIVRSEEIVVMGQGCEIKRLNR